jgi:hypothetical protein
MLHHNFLPKSSILPSSEYLASKALITLGLYYDCIHICPNNCMLFCGEGDGELQVCRVCQAPRYKAVGV